MAFRIGQHFSGAGRGAKVVGDHDHEDEGMAPNAVDFGGGRDATASLVNAAKYGS